MDTRMKTLAAAACGLLTLVAVAAEPVPLFSGSDSYVDLGTPAALQIPSNEPFTVEGWMLFYGFSIRDMLYCKNNGRSSAPYSYILGFANDKMSALSTASGVFVGNFAVTRELDRWYHLAFSFDGTNMAFYLDGELLGSAKFTFANYEEHTIKLGGYHSSYGDIKGLRSDVRVWDHARTQAEIQGVMSNRLSGLESGLLGYWPLNEGAGTIVYDLTAAASDGSLVGASWTNNAALSERIAGQADFAFARAFTLAATETGSAKFTNSNAVNVVAFPLPDGYDRYQINQSASLDGIDTETWTETNDLPRRLTFEYPASDSNIVFYAWFTNTADTVTVARAAGQIRYTTAVPMPMVRSAYIREQISGLPVVLHPEEINDGSDGGETDGRPIPIHALSLNWLSGPATNTTPEKPYVTVSDLGVYAIELVVMNAAGNIATSSVCEVEIVPYQGGAFTWTGVAGENWFNPQNWDLQGVPVTGSDVFIGIGANILLPDTTASLASLSMSGGTLRTSNWWTRIEATEINLTGGTIRPEVAFTEDEMSNRVWIACAELTVGAAAVIHADALGYAGVVIGNGIGPGGAVVSANRGSGGGHGGSGGQGSTSSGSAAGKPYGNPVYPLLPGSSGCYGGAGSSAGLSGNGGGAVLIDASGMVTIEGRVSADGQKGDDYKGSGSGGSVLIKCHTFQGNGTLRADGPDINHGGGGEGGGGRIAVHYDAAAQALLPIPALKISVKAGKHAAFDSVSEFGTIYLSDTRLLTEAVTDIRGWLHVPGFTTWSQDSLTLTNSYLGIITDGFELSVAGDVRGSGNSLLAFHSNVTVAVDGNWDSGLVFGDGSTLTVAGDLRISTQSLPNYQSRMTGTDLSVGGDLDLQYIWRYASGATNGLIDYGSLIDISNSLTVGSGASFYLSSHPTNGGSALIRAAKITLAEGGTINADDRGFGGTSQVNYGPGRGSGGSTFGTGGGYGGRGGFPRYGPSHYLAGSSNGLPFAPLLPGSAGGYAANNRVSGFGGGLVRLEADEVQIDGTLTANGERKDYPGSGAGGGIFIKARTFTGGSNAVLRANGGNYGSQGGGCGGGGRIAVWRGKIDEAVTAKILAGLQDKLRTRLVVTDGFPTYQGTAEAIKGLNDPWDDPQEEAHDGTVIFLTVLPPPGTMFLLR